MAWYRHGRKGAHALARPKGTPQIPSAHILPAQYQQETGTSTDIDCGPSAFEDMSSLHHSSSSCRSLHYHSAYKDVSSLHHLITALSSCASQASRFGAEALAQQSLTMLLHHQSQSYFNWQMSRHTERGIGNSGGDRAIATTAWDCGSCLYDSLELLSLSNQLGRCFPAANLEPAASPCSKLLKNLLSPAMAGPAHPPLQPSYIPRSLHALPHFMIPNYILKNASKKRSSLIHPVFSMPASASNGGSSPTTLPIPYDSNLSSTAEAVPPAPPQLKQGLRGMFNRLLKRLHTKEDQKAKRSSLSEELEKLPKQHPPPSAGCPSLLLQEAPIRIPRRVAPTSSFSSPAAAMAASPSPTSSSSHHSAMAPDSSALSCAEPASAAGSQRAAKALSTISVYGHSQQHRHFQNEGFHTTSIKPLRSSDGHRRKPTYE